MKQYFLSRHYVFLLCLMSLFSACNNQKSRLTPSAHGRSYIVEDAADIDCDVQNGTHAATVDYYNPSSGHTASYDLDVEVENCKVTIIHFNNGGQLDDSHFSPKALDDKHASITDDRDREYDVTIED